MLVYPHKYTLLISVILIQVSTRGSDGPLNNTITKEPKQKSRLWTASNKITGVCGLPKPALSSALVPQILSFLVCTEDS